MVILVGSKLERREGAPKRRSMADRAMPTTMASMEAITDLKTVASSMQRPTVLA